MRKPETERRGPTRTSRMLPRALAVVLVALTSVSRAPASATGLQAPSAATPATAPTASEPALQAPVVDLDALVAEMLDPAAPARMPWPAYRARQVSSRESPAATRAGETTFENHDAGHFVDVETVGESTRAVLFDADGPGVVTRLWSANPRGTLAIHLDGSDTPAWRGSFADLVAGRAEAPPPLAAEHARGFVLEAPIPFARHARIVCEDPGELYYTIAWRAYEPGTVVVTPSSDALLAGWRDAARRLARLPDTWASRDADASFSFTLSRANPRGEFVCTQPTTCAGPRAVSTIRLRVRADDVAAALPRLFLRLSFDGRETVRVPLGDFFGSAPGVNAYESRFTSVRPPNDLECRWIMPYRERFELAIDNVGSVEDVHVAGAVETIPWAFDERTLYFHAAWRPSGPLATRPFRLVRHLGVRGRGVFVGDALTVANPVLSWWGEGDERIRVDGEAIPAIQGTGSEDYYGYAWCDPTRFAAPTCGQTRCDGPANFGFTSLYRHRVLDVVPFARDFAFDMESWHWADTTVERAATVYVYADLDAELDAPFLTAKEAAARAPILRVARIPGATECEDLAVRARTSDLVAERQYLDPARGRTWSGGAHLWCRAQRVGDFVELWVPCEPGTRTVTVYPTKSYDYGRIAFSIDGRRVGDVFDGYNTQAHEPAAPIAVSLGRHVLGAGFLLRAEVVGWDERSEAPHAFFGLDALVVGPDESTIERADGGAPR